MAKNPTTANDFKSKLPTLKTVLSYSNRDVVDRFSRDFNYSRLSAQFIFKDMLRFLWMTQRVRSENFKRLRSRSRPFDFQMLGFWLPIDQMWHTFIVFTADYAKFSSDYFGCFIHHEPGRSGDGDTGQGLSKAMLKTYMEVVYDELGERVLERWFLTYPEFVASQKVLPSQPIVFPPKRRQPTKSRKV